jgi:ABC-2 type transport system ATP-binding protein
MGYVPEVELLDDYLTVLEFLEFIAAIRDVPPGERKARIDHWIAFFDLGEKRRSLLIECSLGMRRKVTLAAAFLGRPDLLLLDEAMNGLDPESRIRLRDELKRQAREGVTILFSTHVIETVETLCDRVLMMAGGRIAGDLSAAEWRGEPGSLEGIFLRRLHGG